MSSDVLENPSPRRWRFTWETLAHIPTLRLYLFHPDVHPSALCGNLSASLRLDQSLLRVSWIDDRTGEGTGDVVFLRVPVPKVLVDPSCPVECRAMDDHIEIKLALVLPVDHPVMMDLRGVLDSDMGEMGRQECGLSDRLLPLPLDMESFCRWCTFLLQILLDKADKATSETLCGNAISELERWLTIGLELAAVLLEDDLEGYSFQELLAGFSDHKNKELVACNVINDSVKGGSGQYFVEDNADVGVMPGAEEELSYRIIVRDLKLKSPMLLLVLLNSKAWSSSGYCSEDSMGSLSAVDLQPVLKVLYSDCSIASEANSSFVQSATILFFFARNVIIILGKVEVSNELLLLASDEVPLEVSSV
ncbi:Inositol monophosphatase family [Musa troglodytarum]|uniref:Inositol monophosphatase family n=1 Tax=Musa troglodytarum TaxID=320322 RepID=A0A9E7HQG7_9LILI|nr:Inositol monophosphatase family [Musa troglodytarum]